MKPEKITSEVDYYTVINSIGLYVLPTYVFSNNITF